MNVDTKAKLLTGKFREPEPTAIGETFWAYCRDDALACQECSECGQKRRYLRRVCARCGSTDYRWTVLSGLGTVYTFTENYFPLTSEFPSPYAVALIDLDEGIRVMSNVVDYDEGELAIGMEVEVKFERVSDIISLPVFRPHGSATKQEDQQ